ncbi:MULTISPECIES: hypothetical protein [Nocardia]|uniref:hypothetical protein n=1 Tax=Nocardia TaxID=1817 RepID=UPI001300AF40|nr:MULTISPECIES: hypothetical protein [Nocardia]
MILPHGQPVTVWRRPARDKHGDTSYVEHHDIEGVAIIDGSQSEPNPSGVPSADRPLAEYDKTVVCPVGADVLASDLLELPDGLQYRVVGRPQRPKHPRSGNQPGVIVNLRRIEG